MRVFCKKYAYMICLVFFGIVVASSGMIIFRHSRDNVLINEVCTSNVSCCMDENGNYPDWIELYNPTTESIDVSGYIVNKSADLKKEKFEIPAGTVIAPASFYLFDPGFTVSSKGCTINLVDDVKHYIDSVQIPSLEYDTCYARENDASLVWSVRSPTPGYSNGEGHDISPVIDGKVKASAESGFYDDEFELKLSSSDWGRSVYYTVDGTDPRISGIKYDGPIHVSDRSGDENVYSVIPEVSVDYMTGKESTPSFPVDKCTVVRAVAKDLLGRYTDIFTYTYFVGYKDKKAYDDMTVVSVAGNPDDLFSHDDGIFVLGRDYDEFVKAGEPDDYEDSSANFTRRGRTAEREVNIEIFDEGGRSVLKTDAGLRIKGLSSRWDVQKSLSVIFRKAYGNSYTETFSAGGNDFDLHSFALDKCGQDSDSKLVDVIMDRCMSDTGCATKKSVPCCVFLNGEYWGFYWLSERFDRNFFAERYGVDKEDVVIADKDEDFYTYGWEIENYDRQSLLEYYAGNIIVAHEGDWPAFNVRFWKTATDEGTPYGDGKFRPVIFDMNSSSMAYPDEDVFENLLEWYPFRNLSYNDEDFRKDLVQKIDEMSANEFNEEKVLGLIDELYDRIGSQMVIDRMRYFNCSETEARKSFDESVDLLRQFYKTRWGYLDEYKVRYYNED